MKILNAKCHSCGKQFEIDKDKKALVCPYCGAKLLIIDKEFWEDPEKDPKLLIEQEKTKQIKIKEEYQKKEEIRSNLFIFIPLLLLIIFALSGLFIPNIKINIKIKKEEVYFAEVIEEIESYIANEKYSKALDSTSKIQPTKSLGDEYYEKWIKEKNRYVEKITPLKYTQEGYIQVPKYDSSGKYELVVRSFELAGFNNINVSEYKYITTGILHSVGDLYSVTINGSSDFEAGQWAKPDAYIEITYYAKKK